MKVENGEDFTMRKFIVYHSPNIVTVITYIRSKCARLVVSIEESRIAFKILTSKPTGKRYLGRSVDRRTELKLILK